MASNLRTIVQKRITVLRKYYDSIKNDAYTSIEVKQAIFNRLNELENVMKEAYS